MLRPLPPSRAEESRALSNLSLHFPTPSFTICKMGVIIPLLSHPMFALFSCIMPSLVPSTAVGSRLKYQLIAIMHRTNSSLVLAGWSNLLSSPLAFVVSLSRGSTESSQLNRCCCAIYHCLQQLPKNCYDYEGDRQDQRLKMQSDVTPPTKAKGQTFLLLIYNGISLQFQWEKMNSLYGCSLTLNVSRKTTWVCKELIMARWDPFLIHHFVFRD